MLCLRVDPMAKSPINPKDKQKNKPLRDMPAFSAAVIKRAKAAKPYRRLLDAIEYLTANR